MNQTTGIGRESMKRPNVFTSAVVAYILCLFLLSIHTLALLKPQHIQGNDDAIQTQNVCTGLHTSMPME